MYKSGNNSKYFTTTNNKVQGINNELNKNSKSL